MLVGAMAATSYFLIAQGSPDAATSEPASLRVAQVASLGKVLVTATGQTLYHTSAEPNGAIKCTGMCAADWPPFLIPAGTKPVAGPGVRASLLGTISRGNRRAQVTYAGMPLYLYSGDKKAGEANGEGVGGVQWLGGTWYAISPSGRTIQPEATALAPAPAMPTVTLPGC
jgi:predicted lipoprotein with Yx(FWY)xxD motif